MEIHSDSGLRISQAADIDYERPELVFIAPGVSRLKAWLRREYFRLATVKLRFSPGLYIFSSLTADDRDLGVYSTRYLDTVIEVQKQRRITLARTPVTIDRRELRPAPEGMITWLREQDGVGPFDFAHLLERFVRSLAEMETIVILSNETFNLVSSFGDTEEEFRETCNDIASIEKSERALELASVIDREMQQNMAHLRRHVTDVQKNKQEVVGAQLEGFELACKRLLNKAISMHVLDPQPLEGGASRSVNYSDSLAAEAEDLAAAQGRYQAEFRNFARSLIERFSEIEQEINAKAAAIGKTDVPPSSCSLQVLRAAIAWLPFWAIQFTADGGQKEKMIRAF